MNSFRKATFSYCGPRLLRLIFIFNFCTVLTGLLDTLTDNLPCAGANRTLCLGALPLRWLIGHTPHVKTRPIGRSLSKLASLIYLLRVDVSESSQQSRSISSWCSGWRSGWPRPRRSCGSLPSCKYALH